MAQLTHHGVVLAMIVASGCRLPGVGRCGRLSALVSRPSSEGRLLRPRPRAGADRRKYRGRRPTAKPETEKPTAEEPLRAARCSNGWSPPIARRRAMPTWARPTCWPRPAARRSTRNRRILRDLGSAEQDSSAGLSSGVGLRRQEALRLDRRTCPARFWSRPAPPPIDDEQRLAAIGSWPWR